MASTYNLQGMLSQEVTSNYTSGTVTRQETVNLVYNDSGIRTSASDLVQTGNPLVTQTNTTTTYLNDADNQTGNSQVIEEVTRDNGTGNETKRVETVAGLDVISQTTFTPGGPTGGTMYALGYDGHGSTRFLTTSNASTDQIYAYDAFGSPLGFDPTTAHTSLLYSGEQWDPRLGLQYLRGRYYDTNLGRFTSFDSYAGDPTNPLSLNKYLYTRNDPILGVDPSGQDFGLGGFFASFSIGEMLRGLGSATVEGVGVAAKSILGGLVGSRMEKSKGTA